MELSFRCPICDHSLVRGDDSSYHCLFKNNNRTHYRRADAFSEFNFENIYVVYYCIGKNLVFCSIKNYRIKDTIKSIANIDFEDEKDMLNTINKYILLL